MSNAKDICTLLLTSVERSLTTIDTKQLGMRASFRNALRGALDLNNNPDYIIHGHPPKTIANSVRSALLHCSTEYNAYSTLIWSPMIAGLFMVVDEVISKHEDILSNRVQNLSIASTSSQPIASTSSHTAAKYVSGTSAKTINKNKTVTSLDTSPSPSVLHTIRSDMLSGSRPIFRNLRHVKCTNKKCKFCADLWLALKPTKCSDVRCHTKDKLCHSSSWYVHVYPDMWSQVKKAHDDGQTFTQLIDYLPRRIPKEGANKAQAVKPAVEPRCGSPSYASVLSAQKRQLQEPLEYNPKSPRTMDTSEEVPVSEQVVEGSWMKEMLGVESLPSSLPDDDDDLH